MQRLRGQTALITGASSGIGKGIAIAYGREGANVVANYCSTKDGADEAVQAIQDAGGRAISFMADVSKEAQVKEMFVSACKEFGTVDILVSNAGIQQDSDLINMTLEQWQRVIDVNLTGGFLCAREATKEFFKRGINKERSMSAGKIIFISSVHEVIPWAGHCNYAASKGGIMLLMKTLAQELAEHKIRVNTISPGAIKTRINTPAWSTPEAEEDLLKLIPYGRVGVPEDIASAAVWLASDESDYVNGASIFVDGGMTLYPEFREGG